MPVEFLTDEQAESYGTFTPEPTRPELERFFFLDDEDRLLIGKRRGDHSRLGFALQVCTVRYIGLFLSDPLAVPWPVVEYLAEQLGIGDPSCVKRYTEREKTGLRARLGDREAFGYHAYDDREWGRKFRTFLYGRAWTHAEGPVALFNHAVAWLRRHRVLLPGVSVLARQISAAHIAAENRLHSSVARAAYRADPALPSALIALLPVPAGARRSELERLRRPPTRSTGTAMAKALDRVNEISGFGMGRVNLSRVPVNRLGTLARYGMASKAALERAPEPRRTALLTAVMRNLEAAAIDDALDLFALLMATRLLSPAKRATDKERLANLPQLERASRTLNRVSGTLVRLLEQADTDGVALDPPLVWQALDEIAPRDKVTAAVAQQLGAEGVAQGMRVDPRLARLGVLGVVDDTGGQAEFGDDVADRPDPHPLPACPKSKTGTNCRSKPCTGWRGPSTCIPRTYSTTATKAGCSPAYGSHVATPHRTDTSIARTGRSPA